MSADDSRNFDGMSNDEFVNFFRELVDATTAKMEGALAIYNEMKRRGRCNERIEAAIESALGDGRGIPSLDLIRAYAECKAESEAEGQK